MRLSATTRRSTSTCAESGTLRLDGEELEVREGLAVRVDPVVRRQPIAGDDGLAWVAIGAPRDGRYEPPAWG